MRARSKTNKVLDIALSEEKFYFPGEIIQGSVIVKPKSSMKVNPIIVKFSGAIFISAKDKEVVSLFQTIKQIPINEGKSKILEPKQYSFPFEFLVPDNLPSAMDFGKNKTARINYKLTVILDRPMMPESLCPKIEYPVLVLEYVDVTKFNFVKSSEKQKKASISNVKCHAKLSVPRTGFTRGETIPVNIIVNTFQSFVKKNSLIIDLIRKVKIQTSRNTLDEEHILKSNKFDLNIIGPYNFTQSITSHLLIRTTPPTIRYKDRVLRVHYKIRAQVFADNKKTPSVVLELPIVIGTWPRADVPIDDDDDEDIIQNMGEVMISDEIDDDDDWMQQQEELEFKRHSNSSLAITTTAPTPVSTKYPYGQHTNNNNNNNNNNTQIRRSGSNNSLGSISSWRSQSTMDPRTSPTSSSNGGASGSVISNHTIPENNYQRNTLPTPIGFKMSNGYLNRSSSTPDLLSNPAPPQQSRTQVIDPTMRSSYYESQMHNNSNSATNGHRSSKSLQSIHPIFLNFAPVVPSQQHRRVGSDEFNNSSSTFTVVSQQIDPNVPNHTLTFLSSSTPTTPPRIVTKRITESNKSSLDESSDDSDYDQDSDDDLFAIIEKKKRKEGKEQKRRQRMMYTVTE